MANAGQAVPAKLQPRSSAQIIESCVAEHRLAIWTSMDPPAE